MPNKSFDIGVVTDEVSRDLGEALAVSRSWGLSRFELREGGEQRFPFFSTAEVGWIEEHRKTGARITAVSPGIFKGHAEDAPRLRNELEDILPRSIELAARFACPLVILFGFERYNGERESSRLRAMQAFEQAAEQVAAAGMIAAVENEPGFWIDEPEASAALLDEIGHPALKLNWDPANMHWGGRQPTVEDVHVMQPYLANVHVKDFTQDDPEAPWRPVGEGITPWPELLAELRRATDLAHVTLETHCLPRIESSRTSLANLRSILEDITARMQES